MVLVFAIAALLAFLVSQALPYHAGGIGIDMMLIYLALAAVVALFRVFRRPRD